MWTCADRLYTVSIYCIVFYGIYYIPYLALAPRESVGGHIHFLYPLFLFAVAGSLDVTVQIVFCVVEKPTPLPNASMADVDEGGFPVETRAKPKILQVDGRPPLPALLCACDTV